MPANIKRLIFIMCLLGIAAGFASRSFIAINKRLIEHDEGFSWASASGQLGDLMTVLAEERSPYGEWVPASRWLDLIEIKPFAFQQITDDLMTRDVHPPLYFWMQNVWLSAVGESIPLWIALNIIIDVFTALTLYLFMSAVLRDKLQALVVVVVWALSPVSIYTAIFVRHYVLLALLSLLFAAVAYVVLYRERSSLPPLAGGGLLIVTGVLGLLSHYNFLVVMIAVACCLIVRWLLRRPMRLLQYGVYAVVMLVLITLIVPDYFTAAVRSSTPSPFTWDEVGSRWNTAHVFLLTFVVDAPYFTNKYALFKPILILTLTVVPAAILLLDWFRSGHTVRDWLARVRNNDARLYEPAFVILLPLAILTGLLILFLGQITVPHAFTSYRHVAVVWVFICAAPVIVLRVKLFAGLRGLQYVALIGVMLLSAVLTTKQLGERHVPYTDASRYPVGDERVVINTPTVGQAVPILLYLQPDNQTFLASQSYLEANPDAWLPQIREDKTLLLTQPIGNLHNMIRTLDVPRDFVPSFYQSSDTMLVNP